MRKLKRISLVALAMLMSCIIAAACTTPNTKASYADFITAVEAIAEVDESSEMVLNTAEHLYSQLSDTDKENPIVIAAKIELDAKRLQFELLVTVASFRAAVEAIGTVTANSGGAITAAETIYNALASSTKQNAEVITLKATLETKKTEHQVIVKVAEFVNAVSSIGTVTLNSGEKISAAEDIFNNLGTLKTNEEVVEAKATLDEKKTEYQNAVKIDSFVKAVGAIGTVTLDSGEAITVAEGIYQTLGDLKEDSQVITAHASLLNKAAKLASLQRVNAFISAVNAIGTISTASGSKLEAADTAFSALEGEENAIESVVAAKNTLEEKRTAYNKAVAEKGFIDAVSALPHPSNVLASHGTQINAARQQYNTLVANFPESEDVAGVKSSLAILANVEEALRIAQNINIQDFINLVDTLGDSAQITPEYFGKLQLGFSLFSDIPTADREKVQAEKQKLDLRWNSYVSGRTAQLRDSVISATASAGYAQIDSLNTLIEETRAEILNSLKISNQQLKDNYSALDTAIENAEKKHANLVAAKTFIDTVEALGEITNLSKREAIAAAESMAQSLTEPQKALENVTASISKLEQKRTAYNAVVASLAQDYADEVAALAPITTESLSAIDSVVEAFNSLHQDVKLHDKATTALQTAQGYYGAFYQAVATAYKNEVDSFVVSLTNLNDITALINKFDSLAGEVQELDSAKNAKAKAIGYIDSYHELHAVEYKKEVQDFNVVLGTFNDITALVEKFSTLEAEVQARQTAKDAKAAAQGYFAELYQLEAEEYEAEVNSFSVTLSSHTAIGNLVAGYNALRAEVQALQTAIDAKNKANGYYTDFYSLVATDFADKVEGVGTIEKTSLQSLEDISAEYVALEAEYGTSFTNHSTVLSAKSKLANHYNAYYDIFATEFAQEVDGLVVALTEESYNEIQALLNEYTLLSSNISSRPIAIAAHQALQTKLNSYYGLEADAYKGRTDVVIASMSAAGFVLDSDSYAEYQETLDAFNSLNAETKKLDTAKNAKDALVDAFNDVVDSAADSFVALSSSELNVENVATEIALTDLGTFKADLEGKLTAYENLFSEIKNHSSVQTELTRLEGLKTQLKAIVQSKDITSRIEYTSFNTEAKTYTLHIVFTLTLKNVYGEIITTESEVKAGTNISNMVDVTATDNRYLYFVENISSDGGAGDYTVTFEIAELGYTDSLTETVAQARHITHGISFNPETLSWVIGGGELFIEGDQQDPDIAAQEAAAQAEAAQLGFVATVFQGGYTVQNDIIVVPNTILAEVTLQSDEMNIEALKMRLARAGKIGEFNNVSIALARKGGTINSIQYITSPLILNNSVMLFSAAGEPEVYTISFTVTEEDKFFRLYTLSPQAVNGTVENGPEAIAQAGIYFNLLENETQDYDQRLRIMLGVTDNVQVNAVISRRVYVYNVAETNTSNYEFYFDVDAIIDYGTPESSLYRLDISYEEIANAFSRYYDENGYGNYKFTVKLIDKTARDNGENNRIYWDSHHSEFTSSMFVVYTTEDKINNRMNGRNELRYTTTGDGPANGYFNAPGNAGDFGKISGYTLYLFTDSELTSTPLVFSLGASTSWIWPNQKQEFSLAFQAAKIPETTYYVKAVVTGGSDYNDSLLPDRIMVFDYEAISSPTLTTSDWNVIKQGAIEFNRGDDRKITGQSSLADFLGYKTYIYNTADGAPLGYIYFTLNEDYTGFTASVHSMDNTKVHDYGTIPEGIGNPYLNGGNVALAVQKFIPEYTSRSMNIWMAGQIIVNNTGLYTQDSAISARKVWDDIPAPAEISNVFVYGVPGDFFISGLRAPWEVNRGEDRKLNASTSEKITETNTHYKAIRVYVYTDETSAAVGYVDFTLDQTDSTLLAMTSYIIGGNPTGTDVSSYFNERIDHNVWADAGNAANVIQTIIPAYSLSTMDIYLAGQIIVNPTGSLSTDGEVAARVQWDAAPLAE